MPVVTETTAASDSELSSGLALFLPSTAGPFTFTRCSGGVNNATYLARPVTGEGAWVVRIYRNGGLLARVRYEHEVLRLLHASGTTSLLPAMLPAPLTPLGAPAGAPTYATLPGTVGTGVCVVPLLPGGEPGTGAAAAEAIGVATARLVRAMEGLVVDPVAFPNPNPIYEKPYTSHHSMSRDSFHAHALGPQFAASRDGMAYLLGELARLEALIAVVGPRLPKQQIHADLHTDNVLLQGGVVTAILDFEFTAHDWRVMELVVGLSKYCGLADPQPPIQAYIDGYQQGGGRLTRVEADNVADLIILRVLSNVIYFVGRAVSREDTWEPITGRVEVYAKRVRWLNEKRGWLTGALAGLVE